MHTLFFPLKLCARIPSPFINESSTKNKILSAISSLGSNKIWLFDSSQFNVKYFIPIDSHWFITWLPVALIICVNLNWTTTSILIAANLSPI